MQLTGTWRDAPGSPGVLECSVPSLRLGYLPVVVGMRNPAVWFADAAAGALADLEAVPRAPGAWLLRALFEPCPESGVLRAGDGRFFLTDPRLELLENSLAAPAVAPDAPSCPTVARSFVNARSSIYACRRPDLLSTLRFRVSFAR